MRFIDWMQEGAPDISGIPYRHNRLGLSRRMTWSIATLFALLAFILLVIGAILITIVLTEVRPPTADENYNRYRGSDYRRILGFIMMGMSSVLLITGLVCIFCQRISHWQDKKHMADYRNVQYKSTAYQGVGHSKSSNASHLQHEVSTESIPAV